MSRATRLAGAFVRLASLCLVCLTFSVEAGEIITLFPAPGGPSGIATGPDGNLWFTEVLYSVGRITPSGVVSDFAIFPTPLGCSVGQPYGCGTWGITSGPDGNMWFVGTRSIPSMARITTDGIVSGVDIGKNGTPQSITLGSDGNLWTAPYGTSTANLILRVTPAGAVTSFPIPSQAGYETTGAYDLAAGPDGNVWFTEPAQRRIGRLTPAGVITEFSVPDFDSPYAIVSGPDGNLWFTAVGAAGDVIGSITTIGAVTTFVIPSRPGRCEDICVGPDGNLWFTESAAGKIGRCTPAGEITEYPVPIARAVPFGIAAGPDGNVWFTSGPSWIGRVNLSYVAALDAQKVPSLERWALVALAVSLAITGSVLLRGRP